MKISIVLIQFILVAGCTTAYKIDANSPKAEMKANILAHKEITGFFSFFSGIGYRLELHSYDIGKCEVVDKVVHLTPASRSEKISVPAKEPLYLLYFYTDSRQGGASTVSSRGGASIISSRTCRGLKAIIPKDNHKYNFDFDVQSNKCIVNITDVTDPNNVFKQKLVGFPRACYKKVRGLNS